MPDYEKMYFHLFAALANAVQALENGNTERALWMLINAQQDTENMYIEALE